MLVKSWRVHPKACKIKKAEKTCMGFANKGGVQWCGPYTNANKAGFWLYPPVDMEFTFDGENFKIHSMEEYGSEDYEVVKRLVKPSDESEVEKWCFPGVGRTKTTFGLVEKNVVQIWTGLIFETPPGWCLHIGSPVNFPRREIEIMEAILETDWLQYDIWVNVLCLDVGKRISIKKDRPLAQLIPMRREDFSDDWIHEDKNLCRDTPESERVFKYWLEYNKKKFESGGRQPLTETLKKDSTTYFRERNRLVSNQNPPSRSCPFAHNKTIEEEREEFKQKKPNNAEFFAVFDRDPSKEMSIIGRMRS